MWCSATNAGSIVTVLQALSFICLSSFFHLLTLLRASLSASLSSIGISLVSDINAFIAFEANVKMRWDFGRCAPNNSSAAAAKWMAQKWFFRARSTASTSMMVRTCTDALFGWALKASCPNAAMHRIGRAAPKHGSR